MARMQYNDASSTLAILLKKYTFNFTLWHETVLLSIINLFNFKLNVLLEFFLNFIY